MSHGAKPVCYHQKQGLAPRIVKAQGLRMLARTDSECPGPVVGLDARATVDKCDAGACIH